MKKERERERATIAGRQGFRNPDEIAFEGGFAMDSDGDYANIQMAIFSWMLQVCMSIQMTLMASSTTSQASKMIRNSRLMHMVTLRFLSLRSDDELGEKVHIPCEAEEERQMEGEDEPHLPESAQVSSWK